MAKQKALTTSDNPWSPFKDFDKWWRWDRDHDYRTIDILASFVMTSGQLSDAVNEQESERAMIDILETNPIAGSDENGNIVYRIVVEEEINPRYVE